MATVQDKIQLLSTQLKNAIDTRTKELLDQIQSNDGHAIFSYDDTLLKTCQSFGHIYTPPSSDIDQISPSKCYVSGNGVQYSTVDEATYITVHLLTESNAEYSHCDDIHIDVHVMNTLNQVVCRGERVKVNGSEVTYRYIPYERGEHTLVVKVLGEHVKRSPFNLIINMPFKLKCIVNKTLTSFYQPGGLAIGPNGELAVIDTKGWQTVHVYNSNNDLVMSTGPWGSGEGQCWEPIGVTFDLSGNILVVDGKNMKIHKFNREGKHVMSVGQKGKEKLEFLRPTGIAVSRAGYVYICDRTNNRIQVLKPNLTFDFTFGGYGKGPGYLHNPWDVAVDSEGFIYITDPGNYCIKKFTPSGEFMYTIGVDKEQEKDKQPKCLEMLCIDQYDYIYATDRDGNCVYVFDTSGRFHTKFGCYGYSEGQFYMPRGIAIKDGKLFVSEVGNKRVQQFG